MRTARYCALKVLSVNLSSTNGDFFQICPHQGKHMIQLKPQIAEEAEAIEKITPMCQISGNQASQAVEKK